MQKLYSSGKQEQQHMYGFGKHGTFQQFSSECYFTVIPCCKNIYSQRISFTPFCSTVSLFTACRDVRRVASVAQISRQRSIFLSPLQKSPLREKKKLHLEEINTVSDQSKMDDTSDPLNLLEQKVIRPLSERSRNMLTTAERTRADLQEQLVEDTTDYTQKYRKCCR